MRVEWLNKARNEFLAFLKYYKSRAVSIKPHGLFMLSENVKSELHQIFIVYFVTSRIVSHSILWYHTPVCLTPTSKGGVSCNTPITKPL